MIKVSFLWINFITFKMMPNNDWSLILIASDLKQTTSD